MSIYKKCLLAGLCLGAAWLPSAVFAAFDDLTLETSAILDVGGYEITVYGSSATLETLVVNENTFVVTLEDGSSIVVASADRVDFVNDAPEALISSEVCSETESRIGFTNTANGETEITVTPSGTCTAVEEEEEEEAEEEEDDNDGGSIGSHNKPIARPISAAHDELSDTSDLIEQLKAALKTLIALGGAVPPGLEQYLDDSSTDSAYTRNLTIGDIGDDVRALQLFLISQNKGPAAQALASNGVTGYFGPLTQAALAEFQAAVGITPAIGFFGPVTREYVNAL
ncbi:MAG: peptidoglycan-binding protein [Candidatus Pacebacteria bacterium]|nr:peptidoglycan-binding protein [Candidatus Paceibacterota bacterium]